MKRIRIDRSVDVRVVPESTTQEHIKACYASSDRARFVIIAINIASILAFVALWNSFHWSWTNERLRVLHDVVKWYPYLLERDYSKEVAQLEAGEVPLGFTRPPEKRELVDTIISKEELPRFKRAKQYLRTEFPSLAPEFGIAMREYAILQAKLHTIQHAAVDNTTVVTVPFVGIRFDVNDLGPIAGLCFIVLLLWLRFAFQRELQNLQSTFDQAEEDDKKQDEREAQANRERDQERKAGHGQHESSDQREKHVRQLDSVYHALAMHQVLTSPRLQDVKNELFWDLVPYTLFSLPAVVQFVILGYDFYTLDRGILFNDHLTIIALMLDFAWLVLILLLTLACARKYLDINNLWNKTYVEVMRLGQQDKSINEPKADQRSAS
ncbi:MAG: hypothetical protein ACKVWV_13815 [Planctomycetota bacterium]